MTRVAIAHDYLTQLGGAERVVLAMAAAFPDAPIYTTLYDPDTTYPEFRDLDVRVSPLNRVAPLRRNHRAALPFLPVASSAMHIEADVVVASSSGWAHGFRTSGRKLVYCHSPARWVYYPDQYFGDHALLRRATAPMRPPLRAWDRRAAAGADRYLTNSRLVHSRIRETYGVVADVVPAPHSMDVAARTVRPVVVEDWPHYHLLVSRLLPYKNVEQAVEAFAELPDERLLIIGRGPLEVSLRAGLPDNVRLAGRVSDDELRGAYAGAHALVAPSFEDYGLTPLEAAAFGVPTLALRAGGYLDTVVEGTTGLYFDDVDAASIRTAVQAERGIAWDHEAIAIHATRFDVEHFARRLQAEVDLLLAR